MNRYRNRYGYFERLSSTLCSEAIFSVMAKFKMAKLVNCKVLSTKTFHLEAYPGSFRLLMSGNLMLMHYDLLWKSWVPNYKLETLQYLQMWKNLPLDLEIFLPFGPCHNVYPLELSKLRDKHWTRQKVFHQMAKVFTFPNGYFLP